MTLLKLVHGKQRQQQVHKSNYDFVNDLGYVLCAAIGCLWAIAGKIAVGNVQAMLEYTWRFAEPFSAIAGMVGSFGAAAAAGNRIFSLLDAEERNSRQFSMYCSASSIAAV